LPDPDRKKDGGHSPAPTGAFAAEKRAICAVNLCQPRGD
jgi:hypothetical protein